MGALSRLFETASMPFRCAVFSFGIEVYFISSGCATTSQQALCSAAFYMAVPALLIITACLITCGQVLPGLLMFIRRSLPVGVLLYTVLVARAIALIPMPFRCAVS